jgi:hypothetical protein
MESLVGEEKQESLLDDRVAVMEEKEVLLFSELTKMKIPYSNINTKKPSKPKMEKTGEPKTNMEQMQKISFLLCQ